MLEFHPLSLDDRDCYIKTASIENSRSADFGFGSMYMWDARYKQLIAKCSGRVIIKLKYEHLPFFAFPIGSGPVKPVIRQMKEFTDMRGYPLRISGITEENKQLLDSECPGMFLYCEDIDYFDYVYNIESMATLSGKKLHGKKNHCNRFEADNPEWSFVPLTHELVPGCIAMLDDWTNVNSDRLHDGITDEHAAILRGFESYDELGLEGGVLLTDGKIIGFTVGERLCDDTFDVHFEKAYTEINGAYPMVAREYARMIMSLHPEVKYLNREDDMGQESMRRAKQAFQPAFMLKKYTARYLG